jgi:hypothetical protein
VVDELSSAAGVIPFSRPSPSPPKDANRKRRLSASQRVTQLVTVARDLIGRHRRIILQLDVMMMKLKSITRNKCT